MVCEVENCRACKIQYNSWLLYNEKIVDFIRWKELFWLLGSIVLGYLIFSWIGAFAALVIAKFNSLEGGPAIYKGRTKEIKSKQFTYFCKKCQEYHIIYKEI